MKKTKSAGGIVINEKGEILIVNQNNLSWSLPKGHIDKDENPLTAAKREIYEETGIQQLDLIENLGKYSRYKLSKDNKDDQSEYKTIEMFLFKTNQQTLNPRDPSNPIAVWADPNAAAALLSHLKDQEFLINNSDKVQSIIFPYTQIITTIDTKKN
ncbi:NUDIX domain-containing protein, partial [Candidatus Margulisiibacteriota bacterium]